VVSLYAIDSEARATVLDSHWLPSSARDATLNVGPTSAAAYVAELRYPGVYFLEGETGGICGRTIRAAFAK